MANEQFVFADDKGNYYVLSQETLDRAKVTGKERARVEEALKGADDTGGFAFQIISPNQTFPDASPSFGAPLKLAGVIRGAQGLP